MSHRLVFVGLSTHAAVCLLYSVAVTLGWTALVITRVDRPTGLVLIGLVALFALVSGFLLALVPVYRETGKARAPVPEAPTRTGADHKYVRGHTQRLVVRGDTEWSPGAAP